MWHKHREGTENCVRFLLTLQSIGTRREWEGEEKSSGDEIRGWAETQRAKLCCFSLVWVNLLHKALSICQKWINKSVCMRQEDVGIARVWGICLSEKIKKNVSRNDHSKIIYWFCCRPQSEVKVASDHCSRALERLVVLSVWQMSVNLSQTFIRQHDFYWHMERTQRNKNVWQVNNKIIIKQHGNKQKAVIVEGNKITDISLRSFWWPKHNPREWILDYVIRLTVTSGWTKLHHGWCVQGKQGKDRNFAP